jgi:hypothetical protein
MSKGCYQEVKIQKKSNGKEMGEKRKHKKKRIQESLTISWSARGLFPLWPLLWIILGVGCPSPKAANFFLCVFSLSPAMSVIDNFSEKQRGLCLEYVGLLNGSKSNLESLSHVVEQAVRDDALFTFQEISTSLKRV